MARAKYDAKATESIKPVKQTISTSTIFKNAKKQSSRRDDRQNRKAVTKLPYWKGKESSKHKRKAKPDHPLVESFDETLKTSHDVIEEDVVKASEVTTEALLQRFRKSEQEFELQLETEAKMDEIIYLPPAEEGIEYARRDGSQSAKSTLGAQMKRFKKTVAEKEKELESLWKQWALVQEELEAIAEDALGPKWATILPSLSTGTETETLDDDDDKAFEKKSKQFEKLIETTSEQALEKMIASEMEFKIKQSHQNQKFLKLFQDEDTPVED